MQTKHVITLTIAAIIAVAFTAFNIKSLLTYSDAKPIRFGIIMNEMSEKVPQQLEPVLKSLEKKIKRPVELVITQAPQLNNFQSVLKGLQNKSVDVGILAPNALARGVRDGSVDAFASILNYDNSDQYRSVLFVHKDSDIKSIKDVVESKKKYVFAYTRGISNFGRRLPTFFFTYYGIDLKELFSWVVRKETFQEIIEDALDRKIDIGVSHTMYMCHGMNSGQETNCSLRENYPGVAENLRVIWESPPIRINSLGYRSDLDDDLKEKIRTFFYSYGKTRKQKKILKNIDFYQIGGFKKIDNSDQSYVWLIREYTKGRAITDANRQYVEDTIGPLQKTEIFYKIDDEGNTSIDEVGLDGWRP